MVRGIYKFAWIKIVKNSKPDIALIRKYLNGELDARAMYELERLAQDDPYLMDVMMGMEMADAGHDKANLAAVDEMIARRIQPVKTSRLIPWKTWSIAAIFVIGISVAGLLFFKDAGRQQMKTADQQAVQLDRNEVMPSADKKAETLLNIPAVEKNLPSAEAIGMVSSNKKAFIAKNAGTALKGPVPSAASASILMETDTQSQLSDSSLSDIALLGYNAVKPQPVQPQEVLAGKVAGVQVNSKRAVMGRGAASIRVKGVVTDAEGNVPLPGVAIRADKSKVSTSTDQQGRFTLEVPAGKESLQIATIGYDTKTVTIKGDDSLFISLNQDKKALSEVVVISYGTQAGKARPVIGWKAYQKYLKDNATVPDAGGGKVTVSFTVNPSGAISKILIVKGVNRVIDEKAVSLISNGPPWMGDSDGLPKEITLKIKFH